MRKSRIQAVRSIAERIPVMIKKGKKIVILTYITKSGQVKNKYMKNPNSVIIRFVKHIQVHG